MNKTWFKFTFLSVFFLGPIATIGAVTGHEAEPPVAGPVAAQNLKFDGSHFYACYRFKGGRWHKQGPYKSYNEAFNVALQYQAKGAEIDVQ